MNDQTQQYQEQNEHLVPGYSAGHFMKWLGVCLLVVAGLLYLAYDFGSNVNKRKINRLNKQLQTFNDVDSLSSIVDQFKSISQNIKLSSNERAKLTDLLDQLLIHKSSLETSESQVQELKAQLQQLKQTYQVEVKQLQDDKQNLTQQVQELEAAMSYSHGTVKNFVVSVNDSYSLLDDPYSRIGLEKILNSGSAQINVGNTLMFFHIGHTLRFRFSPNWLCDVTLIKIDDELQRVEFEYVCEIN